MKKMFMFFAVFIALTSLQQKFYAAPEKFKFSGKRRRLSGNSSGKSTQAAKKRQLSEQIIARLKLFLLC